MRFRTALFAFALFASAFLEWRGVGFHHLAAFIEVPVLAFLFPGFGALSLLMRALGHHRGPFEAGVFSLPLMAIFSALLWWWIGTPVQRASGTFNAFAERGSWWRRFVQMVANICSAIERRRFGREKTGGWS